MEWFSYQNVIISKITVSLHPQKTFKPENLFQHEKRENQMNQTHATKKNEQKRHSGINIKLKTPSIEFKQIWQTRNNYDKYVWKKWTYS